MTRSIFPECRASLRQGRSGSSRKAQIAKKEQLTMDDNLELAHSANEPYFLINQIACSEIFGQW